MRDIAVLYQMIPLVFNLHECLRTMPSSSRKTHFIDKQGYNRLYKFDAFYFPIYYYKFK